MKDPVLYAIISVVGGIAWFFVLTNVQDTLLARCIGFAIIAAGLVAANGLQTRRYCPRCKAALPKFRRPLNKRQFLYGGWTCPKCACEVDRRGKEVVAKTKH